MIDRCWCEIDRNAIRHNLRAVRGLVAPGTAIMPMLKADAYGHGARAVAPVFEQERCEWIGCAHVREGMDLRHHGVTSPILLLSGFVESELEEIIRHDLSITLSSLAEAQRAQRIAKKLGRTLRAHVKVDTGMGRLGCFPADAPALLHQVAASSHLQLAGFYSHYACADESRDFTKQQWQRFCAIPSPTGVPRHICNSAGLLALPQSHSDIVRPGLIVFGISPLPGHPVRLRPALAWKCRVVAVRDVPRGTTLSYGAEFTTRRRSRIVTLAVGYGDGLFRQLSNSGRVLLRGQSCPIRGRVTMDQTLVEAPLDLPVRKGDTAVLLGRSGSLEITASEMARVAGTIPYEIWCHITGRVIKHHIN